MFSILLRHVLVNYNTYSSAANYTVPISSLGEVLVNYKYITNSIRVLVHCPETTFGEVVVSYKSAANCTVLKPQNYK